jgi:replicative superfamily II helicase
MMTINALAAKGVTPEIIEKWKLGGYSTLLPVQEEAINKGAFETKSLLIVAPTSSGKTFVGEMAAVAHALQGRKTLYLVPFKALAEEKYLDFTEKYGGKDVGLIVCISDRDHRETDDQIMVGNYDIGILTYEKLTALLVMNPGILESCDCIVVDEIQMMMDPERGGRLELLLTMIRSASRTKQIVGLSAVLDNLNNFDKWLGAEVVKRKERPVELRQGILLSDGKYEYREWNTGAAGTEHFPDGSLRGVVKHLLDQGEQVIVIGNSVRRVQDLAKELSSFFHKLPAAHKMIDVLKGEVETETRDLLLSVLCNSIAFHHADCELEERRAIENGFRKGEIKILVATTTLSMGVNLPCKSVVLADSFRWAFQGGGFQRTNWLVGEVRNIFGRAGRLGKGKEFGRGILLAPDNREYRRIQGAYLNAPLEDFRSTFTNKDISLRVLDLIATGFGGTEEDITNFIFKTYAAEAWKTTEAKRQISGHIRKGIELCLDNGLCERTRAGKIKVTDLGRVCAGKGCSIESFGKLSGYMEKVSAANTLDISYVAASLDEVSDVFYRGVNWGAGDRLEQLQQRLGILDANGELVGDIQSAVSKSMKCATESFAKAATIALLAKDILETTHVTKKLRDAYNFSSANIRNMCLNMGWMLEVLGGIAWVVKPGLGVQMESIAECIRHKSPLEARGLNSVHVGLSRDERIKLIVAGYKSEDDFLNKKGGDFKGVINPAKADRIIAEINQQRVKSAEYWEREHRRRLDAVGAKGDEVAALYSANGVDLERAIRELFDTGFADCSVVRITDQKKGEPDLLMTFPDGNKLAIQVTASENPTKYIDAKKAGNVIPQSARLHPDGYICIGRPEFQILAKEQASHLGIETNFKLIPVCMLAEVFVRHREGKLNNEACAKLFMDSRGHMTLSEIDRMTI